MLSKVLARNMTRVGARGMASHWESMAAQIPSSKKEEFSAILSDMRKAKVRRVVRSFPTHPRPLQQSSPPTHCDCAVRRVRLWRCDECRGACGWIPSPSPRAVPANRCHDRQCLSLFPRTCGNPARCREQPPPISNRARPLASSPLTPSPSSLTLTPPPFR